MKITVYYEDNRDRTTIEVPDEDCEIWVENDYQRRLAEAEDKSSVVRRTPQQIMDEDCNRPTYNNQHAETRRHVSLDALDPMGDTVIGTEDVEPDFCEDEYTRCQHGQHRPLESSRSCRPARPARAETHPPRP